MSTYTRELVEQLLPAVWDHDTAYGMANPTAPDPDMPRPTADPAHAGTLYAHLADIHTGWQHAPLNDTERRALIMRFGLDWPQKTIARHERIAASTASERLARAVGRIVETLNGTESESDK
ncbi:hypothetical protein [Actinoplanes sp. NPDC049265]|uniref:hypothetical protein n=1 Tax=Actinoplanes sp. NPDC049265 TaxID=3363902 RepID=UPI00372076F1